MANSAEAQALRALRDRSLRYPGQMYEARKLASSGFTFQHPGGRAGLVVAP